MKKAQTMSLNEENNVNQSIFLHIGPQLVFENMKQMKNTTKLNVTCCKSPEKVGINILVKGNYKHKHIDMHFVW